MAPHPKNKLHAPAKDRTEDPSILSLALYHVAIKDGLYRKAVQVYDIPCDMTLSSDTDYEKWFLFGTSYG